jgi:hypothetical protein
MFSWIKISNFIKIAIEKVVLKVGLSVRTSKTQQTINIERNYVKNTVLVLSGNQEVENLLKKGSGIEENISKIGLPKIDDSNQLISISKDLLASEKNISATEQDKKILNSRIDEVVVLMNQRKFPEAQTILFQMLGEVRNRIGLENEKKRIYNNLGVTFSFGSPLENLEEAVKYFNLAIEIDPQFVKARTNLAAAFVNMDSEEKKKNGLDLIKLLWEKEKNSDVLQILFLAIYRVEGRDELLSFSKKKEVNEIVEKSNSLLTFLANIYLEKNDFNNALPLIEKSLKLLPDKPETLYIKANALMIKQQSTNIVENEFDIIPNFKNPEEINEPLALLKEAEKLATKQNKPHLLPDIKYALATCLMWAGKYEEAKIILDEIKVKEESGLIRNRINVLIFAYYIHHRDFEIALDVLEKDEYFKQLPYREMRRLARVFLVAGAAEQAKKILDEINKKAEEIKDIYYWIDLSVVFMLLERKSETLTCIKKIKELSENVDTETQKLALAHINAIILRYSTPEGGQDSENNRLMESMQEFHNKFPDSKAVVSIKAIGEDGQLTDEIKNMLMAGKERYEKIKDTFGSQPFPSYLLETITNRQFIDIITSYRAINFPIKFTDVTDYFIKKLEEDFTAAKGFVFDYLSLLDLAKMDFLGFLEKLNKPIVIYKSLFEKIQLELVNNEVEELRKLWEFLRKSKVVIIVDDKIKPIDEELEKMGKFLGEWLIDSIKYANLNNYSLVTNDLNLLIFIRSKKTNSINIMPFLNFLLEEKYIDSKSLSRAKGDLAERYYTFISFTGDDLLEIVLEDKGKITARSYHLINQIFLPGSATESFVQVFVSFIEKFWKTGSLSQEKVSWIKFLSETFIAKFKEEAKNKSKDQIAKLGDYLGIMWNVAIKFGNKDDLLELNKIIDQVFANDYFSKANEISKRKIKERLKELGKK